MLASTQKDEKETENDYNIMDDQNNEKHNFNVDKYDDSIDESQSTSFLTKEKCLVLDAFENENNLVRNSRDDEDEENSVSEEKSSSLTDSVKDNRIAEIVSDDNRISIKISRQNDVKKIESYTNIEISGRDDEDNILPNGLKEDSSFDECETVSNESQNKILSSDVVNPCKGSDDDILERRVSSVLPPEFNRDDDISEENRLCSDNCVGFKKANANTNVGRINENEDDDNKEKENNEIKVAEFTQRLDLKPATKFECYRCGVNNFCTIAVLQEHIASCTAQRALSTVHSDILSTASCSTPVKSTASDANVANSISSSHIVSPAAITNSKITRKVFLCSSCGNYYQNYNLYIHMRETHNKQICLFCLKIFGEPQQLWDHLVSVHKLQSAKYDSISQIKNAFKSSFYVSCCACNAVFSDGDRFHEHACRQVSNRDKNTNNSTYKRTDQISRDSRSARDSDAGENNDPIKRSESYTFDCVASTSSAAGETSEKRIRTSLSSAEEDDRDTDDDSDVQLRDDEFLSPNSTKDIIIGAPENVSRVSFPQKVDEQPPVPAVCPTVCDEKEISRTVRCVNSEPPEPCSIDLNLTKKGDKTGKDASISDEAKSTNYNSSSNNDKIHEDDEAEECETGDSKMITTSGDEIDDNSVVVNAAEPDDDVRKTSDKDHSNNVIDENERKLEHDEVADYSATPASNRLLTRAKEIGETNSATSSDGNPADLASLTGNENAELADCLTDRQEDDSAAKYDDTVTAEQNDTNLSDNLTENENNDIRETVERVTSPLPPPMELMLDEPVESTNMETLVRECVKTSSSACMYCYNATIIAVNGSQLTEHLSEHRYAPTRNDADSERIVEKLKRASTEFDRTFSRPLVFDGIFVCFQCAYTTTLLKELCQHKKKTHQKNIFLCIMCKCNFVHYSELLCHLCPGTYSSESQNSLNFRCCFCTNDNIPSAFRLMVHLRKIHHACDICLSRSKDQHELFSHMTKQHKMHHMCYKCNLAYRSRDDISKHLFWKHGTESVLCKKCLQKKWSHAYHFCVPASTFSCDECSCVFTKAVAVTVHRRIHTDEFPFECVDCNQRFISKRLLAAHQKDVHRVAPPVIEDAKETPSVMPVSSSLSNDKITAEKNVIDNQCQSNDAQCSGGGGKEEGNEKKKRKKSRKKVKTNNEKTLLDELPPLNLSSESEDDSADEESVVDTKTKTGDAGQISPPPPEAEELPEESTLATSSPRTKPDPEQALADSADVNDRTDGVQIESVKITSPIAIVCASDENTLKDVSENCDVVNVNVAPEENVVHTFDGGSEKCENDIEKILNCLTIEHSYCIPDSIFRSEFTGDNYSSSANVSEQNVESSALQSPPRIEPPKNRDKSCSKSVTPKKRKCGAKKNVPGKDSSTTESSSDSDSSSSSCGSNCSCNRSACSSSSSTSECSTTPDKKKIKTEGKTKKDKSDNDGGKRKEKLEKTQSPNEESYFLNVAESDLDTDLSSLDENFYDEHPTYTIPPIIENKPSAAIYVDAAAVPSYSAISMDVDDSKKKQSSRSRKNKKRKKNFKIKINLNNKIAYEDNSATTASSANSQVVYSKGTERSPLVHTFKTIVTSNEKNIVHFNKNYESRVPTEVNVSDRLVTAVNSANTSFSDFDENNASRLSKRKRVKNKFYGYTSSDEDGNHESLKKVTVKKLSSRKKPTKDEIRPFIGIRAKKPFPILPPEEYLDPLPSPPLPPKLVISNISTSSNISPYVSRNNDAESYSRKNSSKNMFNKSSDDSDSDERKHKLVISVPVSKHRKHSSSYRSKLYAKRASFPQENFISSQQRMELNSQPPPMPAIQSADKINKLYCYCHCPYDEVSEMIACDGHNCKIEWFHFECVQIKVPPKGKWFCPDCRGSRDNVPRFFKNQSQFF